VGADKPLASDLADRSGNGLWSTQPSPETVKGSEEAAGVRGGRRRGATLHQVHLCWPESEEEGIATAHRVWPNAGIPGDLTQELVIPRHYERSSTTPSAVAT